MGPPFFISLITRSAHPRQTFASTRKGGDERSKRKISARNPNLTLQCSNPYVRSMFYTYIITNKRNGTLYTGHTDTLGQRMEQHKTGRFAGFAKKYGCKSLVWYETHETRDAAFKRERQIKKWNRGWKLRLIESENPDWIDIAHCPQWPLPRREIFSDLKAQIIRDHALPR